MYELDKKLIKELICKDINKPIFILVYQEDCSLSLDYFDDFIKYIEKYKNSRFFYININELDNIEQFTGICCTPACYIFYKNKRYIEYYLNDNLVSTIINYIIKTI